MLARSDVHTILVGFATSIKFRHILWQTYLFELLTLFNKLIFAFSLKHEFTHITTSIISHYISLFRYSIQAPTSHGIIYNSRTNFWIINSPTKVWFTIYIKQGNALNRNLSALSPIIISPIRRLPCSIIVLYYNCESMSSVNLIILLLIYK